MDELLAKLAAPFDPATISWRVGPTTKDKSKGMALAYIDARDVMNRFDAVLGPGGWQCDYPWSDGKRVVCRIGVKIGDEWVWKGDGAGDSDTEGEKGALSDAFKRSAVKWGVGRYLYDTESPWVAIEQKGGSYVIAEQEFPRLRRLLGERAGIRAPSPAPKPAPQSAAPLPSRLEEFFKRPSYEIDPAKVGGTTSKWEIFLRDRAAECRNLDEFVKLEDDNLPHRQRFEQKSRPEVVENLRKYLNDIHNALQQKLPGLAA